MTDAETAQHRFAMLRRTLASTTPPVTVARPRPTFEDRARRRLLERLATALAVEASARAESDR